MKKLKKTLLYAGLERERLLTVWPDALRQNARTLETFSLVAFCIFLVLTVINLFTGDFATINQPVYLGMAVLNGLLWIAAKWLVPRKTALTMPLCYVFAAALFAFGMVISANHPDMPAVTFVVMLVMVPFVFIDSPVRVSTLLALVSAAACVMTVLVKEGTTTGIDIWNILSFMLVAIVAVYYQMRLKLRMLIQDREIRYLSETDVLTGTKNRNCFEMKQRSYAEGAEKQLVCAYIDVNGLHRLNDTKGHSAGDHMLRTVAVELLGLFGEEDTYRIGGDEFLAFSRDKTVEELRAAMERISAKLREMGYYISCGIVGQDGTETDLDKLILAAEQDMYRAKQRYYQQSGIDRRRN